jgi:hypothetical protein
MRFRLILFLFFSLCVGLHAQDKHYAVYGVAFYNVENLFDPLDSPDTNDEEFTPKGSYNWTETKYENKLENMASVLNQLGDKYCPMGPAVIGVAEVENRKVLEDLVKTGDFATKNYQIVHQDSPDRRGIDVALLYNPSLFKPESYKAFSFTLPDDTAFRTRDQLLVSGAIAGEKIHVIVNHWPSRRAKSIRREQAAAVTRTIVDSLRAADPNVKVMVMGDLNDDPTNASVKKVLSGKQEKTDVGDKDLFNPFWKYYANGIGTLGYKGHWDLFDQIMMTRGLTDDDKFLLTYWKAEIFNRDFLINQEGPFKGYPRRTHSKGIYFNGYSDHLPVIIYLVKQTIDR